MIDKQREIFYTLWDHPENEVVEFKKAEFDYSFDKLGKYFSALSNEANLRDKPCGWLIMGIWDKKTQITGTNYKNDEAALNKLKHDLAQQVTDGMTFRNIYEITVTGKRVLMFEIPAAPRNTIVKFQGIAYARDGESLVTLNQDKYDSIRFQNPYPDWTAVLVESATIADLDELALATARIMFKKVHSATIPASEVDEWSTEEFLTHSEMMRDGKLTRAAILLLGQPLALQKIHPANAQITWIWRDKNGEVMDYEHFSIPYILTSDKIFSKIRNRTMRELPGGTLFPDTMKQYEDYSVREALNNALAHQDYGLESRVVVEENEDFLFYSNRGDFIPKSIERVLKDKSAQKVYRNKCLTRGMVHFNMIDTVGRGIPKMFSEQRRRFFPMPEYVIDPQEKTVSVTIYGVSSGDAYADLLKSDSSLSLMECLWLDAVRQHKPITKEAAKHLKERNLIEGKAPHYNIALSVAQKAQQVGHYTKETGLNKDAITKLVLQLAHNADKDGFKRADVLEVLDQVLPARMSKDQKLRNITTLLMELYQEEFITKSSNGKVWFITKKGEADLYS